MLSPNVERNEVEKGFQHATVFFQQFVQILKHHLSASKCYSKLYMLGVSKCMCILKFAVIYELGHTYGEVEQQRTG